MVADHAGGNRAQAGRGATRARGTATPACRTCTRTRTRTRNGSGARTHRCPIARGDAPLCYIRVWLRGQGVAELVFSAADSAPQLRPQASIKRAATAVTAFVGRTLKGPVNQPIAIGSFDDYQRVFGGLWQPSMLSYALEQYFQNGGPGAIVVRVCNGCYCPTLRLAAR